MLKNFVFAVFCFLALSNVADAQATTGSVDSESFTSLEDHFYISIPRSSMTAKAAPAGAMGEGVTGTVYSCTLNGVYFQVGVAHYLQNIVTDDASYQKFLSSADATTAAMKAKIESKKEIKLDGYPGYETVLTLANGAYGISRAFAVGKTMYNVIALYGTKDAETEKSVRATIDSFKLISLGAPVGGKLSVGVPAKASPASTPIPAASSATSEPKKVNDRAAAPKLQEAPAPEPYDKADVKAMAGLCVTLDTEAGFIVMEMFPDSAPESVRNFLNMAGAGWLDNTTFSRVVPNFVIQGGDLSTSGKWDLPTSKRARRTVPDEPSAILHERGIVSMARTDQPNSATTDFFILLMKSDNLDGKFAAFGRVTKGMDVAEAINKMPGANEKPDKPVKIKKASVAACAAAAQ